jgi:DNA replication and repair protein RecF
MRLAWVELRDFRNHAYTRIEPVPDGLIVAVGPNGEGKTNLLEGICYLFTLSSPRVSASGPLVRDGAEAAYSRGEVATLDGKVLVEVEVPTKGASRVKVNRSPVRRKRDLRRQVRAVFFGPDDLDVVRGDPSHRRRFLDEAVVALWPLKESLLTGYDRALRQRNRLLKEWDRPGVPAGMEAWDAELIQAGAALIRARADAIDRLAPPASEEFEALAGYGLACTYAPNIWSDTDLEQAFRARIEERRSDELARRSSLVGPHRDDVELAVRDLGARAFASHGEAWAAALCLRLGLATAVEREIGEPPILLVDDPFSALDPRRRDLIGERLAARGGQVVISVADEADVPDAAHATWDVRAGTVTPRVA